MLPELVIAGRLRLDFWMLSVGVAAAAVFLSGLRNARRAGADPEAVWAVWPWGVLGGVLGARLYYLGAVGDAPPLFALSSWSGLNVLRGTSIQGAVIGGTLLVVWVMRRRKEPVLPLLDAFAPGAALAHGFTRLGCLAAGCCWGRPTGLPWAVVFTHPNSAAPRGVPLHPAQLYEVVFDAALAWHIQRRLAAGGAAPGDAFWRYAGGYSLVRFLVQFLRDDDAGHLFLGMAHSQYLSLALLAFALAMMRRGRTAH